MCRDRYRMTKGCNDNAARYSSGCNKDAAVTIHVRMRFCSLDLANPSCALDPRPRRASFLGLTQTQRCALMIIIEVGSRRRRR
jgi:hypothetical protein